MKKARSPRYPVIGLSEALEKVRLVYAQDYQNKIPKHVVAQHMGYGSLNGKSLGVISAAMKYGLLDGRANEMRVSDGALAIIANEVGTSERMNAIASAAARPELFAELDGKFSEGRASDAAIRTYLLMQRKFLPHAADVVIRTYRDSKQLVQDESMEFNADESSNHAGQHGTIHYAKAHLRGVASLRAIASVTETTSTRLSTDCTVKIDFQGPVTRKAILKLIWYLEGVIDTYPDDIASV